MKSVLSEIPALRNFYKSASIAKELTYASDSEVLGKAKDTYIFWKKVEDPQGLYVSNKDENSSVVKLGDLVTIEDFSFYNKELIQKARKTLVDVWFENAKKAYEENLATIKSEKKKKMLAIPVIETYMEKVFAMTDYDVFFNLELNDYFVFEQKESLIDSENEGREILLKVEKNEKI